MFCLSNFKTKTKNSIVLTAMLRRKGRLRSCHRRLRLRLWVLLNSFLSLPSLSLGTRLWGQHTGALLQVTDSGGAVVLTSTQQGTAKLFLNSFYSFDQHLKKNIIWGIERVLFKKRKFLRNIYPLPTFVDTSSEGRCPRRRIVGGKNIL